ncbi:plectin isoform X1 [Macadamia integrifolia]|uniref:plectin isoform X1 n=1 Tax=Macadamia integrifolia TaxID=60698 RepID=UPI001C4F6BBC|nr:plectin isoform X1 [Macadamia integrifolia]
MSGSMALADREDDMGSLFEGMILFGPSHICQDDDVDGDDRDHQSLPPASPPIPTSSSQSHPLDENLFSDLTLVTPNEHLVLQLQSDPSPTTTSEASETAIPSIARQVSRRKKKGGIRIGYGRDASLADHHSSAPSSDSNSQEDKFSIPSTETDTSPSQPIVNISVSDEDSRLPTAVIPGAATLDPDSEEGTLSSVVNDVLRDENLVPPGGVHELSPLSLGHSAEEKLEQVRARVSAKLEHIRELAASISTTRKEFARRRREAIDRVNLASIKHTELERELEEACDAEDFERAERVSESIAAAETEKQGLINLLKVADTDCDSIELKMQEVWGLQIAAEEESVSLLEQFTKEYFIPDHLRSSTAISSMHEFKASTFTLSKETATSADLVLKNVESVSSKEMDEWISSMEALEEKKLELEIYSLLMNDARLGFNDSIDHLIKDDRRQKEFLSEKRLKLTEELEELLTLVRNKEAEIAQNDSNIDAVEKKIADAVSGFHDIQLSIDMKYDNLKSALSRTESSSGALYIKKKEIDDFLSQEEERVARLRELAIHSANEAKACQEIVGLRKSLVSSVFKLREDKVRLAKTEERILEEVQHLRQEVSAARASLQELSSRKSSIQQEVSSSKQRIFFIEKRGPELEAEKKVAATARNFKEAGRIAAEAKALTVEKESIQLKLKKAILDLGEVEEGIELTANRMKETEGLIISKEKGEAMARCERLHLAAGAAMAERSAALELGDFQEAKVLLAEVEAAESEAKKLQQDHNFEEDEFGSLPKHFISMELITSLGGEQLAEMEKSFHISST